MQSEQMLIEYCHQRVDVIPRKIFDNLATAQLLLLPSTIKQTFGYVKSMPVR